MRRTSSTSAGEGRKKLVESRDVAHEEGVELIPFRTVADGNGMDPESTESRAIVEEDIMNMMRLNVQLHKVNGYISVILSFLSDIYSYE